MASLQDQLLKAGIVDDKKAKTLKREKRKAEKAQQKGKVQLDQDKEQARLAREDKVVRDRALNKQKQDAAQEKAVAAQIIQMIQMNRIDRGAGELAYQFADGSKIKKIYITAQLHNDLIAGRIAIAKLGSGYELLPAAAADKIMQRDEKAIVVLNINEALNVDEDDPYADYQVPDDLMW
jgi:uncharacterized protein YaiL (DUF2058 family)